MTQREIIRRARRIALAAQNEIRELNGEPPVKRVERSWWRAYGSEYVADVRAENGIK